MSGELKSTLVEAVAALNDADVALGRSGTKLPAGLADRLRKATARRNELKQCIQLLEVRQAAAAWLKDLETRGDVKDWHHLGPVSADFATARLLGCQAFLSATWSIVDIVSTACLPLLSSHLDAIDQRPSASLLKDYMGSERQVTAFLGETLKLTFGWPTCLCYAARNTFLHEAALTTYGPFFEGEAKETAFRISDSGWRYLDQKYREKKNGFEDKMHRAPEEWPHGWHQDDFRSFLELCVREMDVALSILVGSAAGAARAHAELLEL